MTDILKNVMGEHDAVVVDFEATVNKGLDFVRTKLSVIVSDPGDDIANSFDTGDLIINEF